MTITDPNPAVRNGVHTDNLFATLDVVRETARAGSVPVPGHQPVGQRHA